MGWEKWTDTLRTAEMRYEFGDTFKEVVLGAGDLGRVAAGGLQKAGDAIADGNPAAFVKNAVGTGVSAAVVAVDTTAKVGKSIFRAGKTAVKMGSKSAEPERESQTGFQLSPELPRGTGAQSKSGCPEPLGAKKKGLPRPKGEKKQGVEEGVPVQERWLNPVQPEPELEPVADWTALEGAGSKRSEPSVQQWMCPVRPEQVVHKAQDGSTRRKPARRGMRYKA